jgi:hypothetical protein
MTGNLSRRRGDERRPVAALRGHARAGYERGIHLAQEQLFHPAALRRRAEPRRLKNHCTQSAMKMLISRGRGALRLEDQTNSWPSGENMGKELKPPAKVMRSRRVPLRLTA